LEIAVGRSKVMRGHKQLLFFHPIWRNRKKRVESSKNREKTPQNCLKPWQKRPSRGARPPEFQVLFGLGGGFGARWVRVLHSSLVRNETSGFRRKSVRMAFQRGP
jgi:hypothetical protein